MVTVPVVVALVLTIYAMGGPDRALVLMEQLAQDAWTMMRNAVR